MSSRELTEKEIQDLARFLSGEMDEAEITALRTLLIKDLSFRKEVERLASIETSLSDALAVFESKSAPLIQPPGWALANLDRTVSHSFKRSKEGSYLDFFKDIRGFRLAFAGFACLLLAASVIIFSRNNAKENEFASYDKELQNLVKLSPSAFLAQSSESQQFRSTSKQVLSPNGLTQQHDPYLILSPRLRNNNYNVEVIDLLDPSTMPLRGTYKGKPERLSVIVRNGFAIAPGRPYKIKVFASDDLVAETLFKGKNEVLQTSTSDRSKIEEAYFSLKDTPARLGDALSLLESLPDTAKNNQASLRIYYLIYRALGDEELMHDLSQRIKAF
jgi:hypothetical protein